MRTQGDRTSCKFSKGECLPGAYDIGPQLLLNALMGHIGEPVGML